MEFKFTINADNWTLGDYVEFIEATETGKIRSIVEKIPALIESWTLPSNPKDVKSLYALKLAQWKAIAKEVNHVLTQEFDAPKA